MKKVVETFDRSEDEVRVRLTGKCPRCHDAITVDIEKPPDFGAAFDVEAIEAIKKDDAKAAAEPDPGRHYCNCRRAHAGHGDRSGCGVYGYAFARS